MGIEVKCPECGFWNSEKASICKGRFKSGPRKGELCGFKRLKKAPNKNYRIEYRINGKKRREYIGLSKEAAKSRFLEVKKAKIEHRHIKRDKNSEITLESLFDWFLNLTEVQRLDSYPRIKVQIKALSRLLNTKQTLRDVTIAQIENYAQQRLQEPSPNKLGRNIAPKTVKEEISLLRNIFNRGVRHEFISEVPLARFPAVKVDNVRTRIFTDDEYQRLIAACPVWLRHIVMMAYWTGMRQNEIIQLEWNHIDFKEGFIRLKASQTKTDESRLVRLSPPVLEMLREIPRKLHIRKVFLSKTEKRIPRWGSYQRKAWSKALEQAGIENAVFHDLRHDFVTKSMREGNPAYLVMKQVGHKTDSMLRRYQLIDERDLRNFKFGA